MKLLIAEDDASTRLLLSAILRKLGYDVLATESGSQAWDAYQKGDYRIVISDWNMPDMNGLELCRKIRSVPTPNYIYFLLLTAYNGKDNYLDAIATGADDFMSKPFDKEVLAARLHVAKRILNLQETLQFQATHDLSTGIWNRSAMLDFLNQELDRSSRENKSVGVVLADLDHFKQINDTCGHQAGDQVLQVVAERLKTVLRPYDRVGRYGGEEFLMVLPGCDAPTAAKVAGRILKCFDGVPIPTCAGDLQVTCSLGAVASDLQRRDVDSLIRAADDALYRAKRSGRNRVVVQELDAGALLPHAPALSEPVITGVIETTTDSSPEDPLLLSNTPFIHPY